MWTKAGPARPPLPTPVVVPTPGSAASAPGASAGVAKDEPADGSLGGLGGNLDDIAAALRSHLMNPSSGTPSVEIIQALARAAQLPAGSEEVPAAAGGTTAAAGAGPSATVAGNSGADASTGPAPGGAGVTAPPESTPAGAKGTVPDAGGTPASKGREVDQAAKAASAKSAPDQKSGAMDGKDDASAETGPGASLATAKAKPGSEDPPPATSASVRAGADGPGAHADGAHAKGTEVQVETPAPAVVPTTAKGADAGDDGDNSSKVGTLDQDPKVAVTPGPLPVAASHLSPEALEAARAAARAARGVAPEAEKALAENLGETAARAAFEIMLQQGKIEVRPLQKLGDEEGAANNSTSVGRGLATSEPPGGAHSATSGSTGDAGPAGLDTAVVDGVAPAHGAAVQAPDAAAAAPASSQQPLLAVVRSESAFNYDLGPGDDVDSCFRNIRRRIEVELADGSTIQMCLEVAR